MNGIENRRRPKSAPLRSSWARIAWHRERNEQKRSLFHILGILRRFEWLRSLSMLFQMIINRYKFKSGVESQWLCFSNIACGTMRSFPQSSAFAICPGFHNAFKLAIPMSSTICDNQCMVLIVKYPTVNMFTF